MSKTSKTGFKEMVLNKYLLNGAESKSLEDHQHYYLKNKSQTW